MDRLLKHWFLAAGLLALPIAPATEQDAGHAHCWHSPEIITLEACWCACRTSESCCRCGALKSVSPILEADEAEAHGPHVQATNTCRLASKLTCEITLLDGGSEPCEVGR